MTACVAAAAGVSTAAGAGAADSVSTGLTTCVAFFRVGVAAAAGSVSTGLTTCVAFFRGGVAAAAGSTATGLTTCVAFLGAAVGIGLGGLGNPVRGGGVSLMVCFARSCAVGISGSEAATVFRSNFTVADALAPAGAAGTFTFAAACSPVAFSSANGFSLTVIFLLC